jgi:hypothetical protein
MLTRLTLAILDYAVNDAKQFTKRTKDVELYIDEHGRINYDGKGIKISATIPIDVPSTSIVTLDSSAAYGRFLTLFGKATADHLMSIVQRKFPRYYEMSPQQQSEYWARVNPDDLNMWEEPGLKPALTFIQRNGIVPSEIPSEELLRGPAAYEQKGSASAGLQQLGEQLNGPSPPTHGTGRLPVG